MPPAKKATGFIKLQIPGGAANPAPPVGPALGSRCALEPSCSRYFVHAARKHGLLGVPMTADRFVREPVVSAPDRPWVRNADGAWRHPDPVEDHDWWFD